MSNSKKIRNVFIPIEEVSDGLFSNEDSIVIKLADGRKVSLYADKDLIMKKDESFFLKVTLIEEKAKTVLLPSEAFETSSSWATVSELKFA
ncbi:MAG: hypothetical protein AB2L13_14055 [Spirochaetota bacterium]|jgi:hypothetical protein